MNERLRADHDSGGVDRVRARQSLEGLGELDDLLGDGIRVERVSQLRAGLQRLVEGLAGTLRNELGDAVGDAIGHLEHPRGVTDGRAGGHRGEGDDLSDPVTPVLLGDVVDHPLTAGHRKVDVHVRHRLPAGVEKALEQELVAHRVDVGDLEAVGDERAGCGAATGTDADLVSLGEADEVGDDQEVVGKAHLPDGLELELEPLGQLRRHPVVPLAETLLAQLDQIVERVPSVGCRKRGQQDPAELDLDVAAIRDLERSPHRVLVAGEVERHLLRCLEIELVGLEAPVVGVLERVARLDAQKRLMGGGIGRVEVVHVTRGDEREIALGGQSRELRDELRLDRQTRVLQLDVRRPRSEDLGETVELGLGIGGPRVGERAADTTREAPREGDQPGRVALQQLPVDARPVVVPLQVAERAELDQVGVTLVRLGEQGQVRMTFVLGVPVVDDVHLTADDRLYALPLRCLVEVDRTGERAVIGERDRGHLEPGGLRRKRRYPARTVEDRVLRVDVEMDERRGQESHRITLPRTSSRMGFPACQH